jgi:hypothetical protein
VKIFKDEYGDDAYPIVATGEGLPLEHLGLRGVVLPRALVVCLKRALPPVETLQREMARAVKERYALEDLTDAERKNFLGALDLLADVGVDLRGRAVVVQLGDATILGLHQGEEIQISRAILGDWGQTLMVLIHEAAHDLGVDGSMSHVNREEALVVKVFNRLRAGRPG